MLALAALAVAAFLVVAPPWQRGEPAAAAAGTSTDTDTDTEVTAPAPASAPPSPEAAPSPSPSPSPRKTRTAPPVVPASGPGTFTVARAGASSGGGNAYRVEVEDGSGVDPDEAADRIADILASPRGWTHGGAQAFRQVTEGPAGMVVKIATAATTDRICGSGGMNTHGEVNCRLGETVVVNLKRWQTGSPEFDGPLAEYRALIINHEVGHWLGHGHEGCPGKGRPAPAMMQQIYGLKGCVANAWPYDAHGRYLGGPAVP